MRRASRRLYFEGLSLPHGPGVHRRAWCGSISMHLFVVMVEPHSDRSRKHKYVLQ